MHNRQDGGDCILGKQLLASENDDHKTKGITKVFKKKTAGHAVELNMKNTFCK